MGKFNHIYYKNTDNCCFCEEFGNTERVKNNSSGRIFFENNSFVSFVSAGALVEGHLLIASKKHWRSISQLPNETYKELNFILKETTNWIKRTYNFPVIEFEHGVCSENSGGCGIDHAHIHVMPWPLTTKISDIIANYFSSLPYVDLNALQLNKYIHSYLYIKDIDDNTFCFHVNKLPSQYMRQQLSKALCNSNWDWRYDPINKHFVQTLQKKSNTETHLYA